MTIKTFEDLHLLEFIQKAILDLGFETPSAIQAEAIPHLLNGEDIIAMAPTGSGKTFAFGVPILQKIDVNNKSIQALVLCPTRELVIQAHKEFEKFSIYNEDIKIVSIYGGQQIGKQLSALKREPQIIIATPGRLMDHLRQNNLSIKHINTVVLDEADEMLDMGFRDDINTILEQTNKERQTVLFSATMENEIKKIAEKFQKSPCIVDVLDNLQSLPDIQQNYIETSEKSKPELTLRLLGLHNLSSVLVFCNTKTSVDKLVEILRAKGFQSDAIHGDMNQAQREKVMSGFRKGSVKILVATDVASRGIDVKDVEAVFNYDIPREDEDYIHRIGRTGRAGSSGVAFSLVTKRQVSILKRIERANGVKINKQEPPSVEMMEESRFKIYENQIAQIIRDEDLSKFHESISSLKSEGFTELEIASALFRILNKKEQIKINKQVVFEDFTEEKEEKRSRRNRRNSRFDNKDDKFKRNGGKGKSDKDSLPSVFKFSKKNKKRSFSR